MSDLSETTLQELDRYREEVPDLRAQLAAAQAERDQAHRERDGIQELWSRSCDTARAHCPVVWGESHITHGIPRLAADRDRLAADNARLRDALERIERYVPAWSDGISENMEAMSEIARAALAPPPDAQQDATAGASDAKGGAE